MALWPLCGALSRELKDYQEEGSGENMNNAESLTVRLIIGHCGHRDGDGSMLSGHNFE